MYVIGQKSFCQVRLCNTVHSLMQSKPTCTFIHKWPVLNTKDCYTKLSPCLLVFIKLYQSVGMFIMVCHIHIFSPKGLYIHCSNDFSLSSNSIMC